MTEVPETGPRSANRGRGLTVVDLLDRLEHLVVGGRRVPFTPSVLVSEDEVLELIDEARAALPEDLKEAQWILEEHRRLREEAEAAAREVIARATAEADATLAAARKTAEEVLSEARERAEAMVASSEILRVATERAEAVVRQAEEAAAAVRRDADAYARGAMERLEATLVRLTATVRQGIEELERAQSPPSERTRQES